LREAWKLKKGISALLAVILGLGLLLPAQLAHARLVSDLEAYQHYIINMNFELALNHKTYALYYRRDKNVVQPDDRNSAILFLTKRTETW
jgi:hypothetical protein